MPYFHVRSWRAVSNSWHGLGAGGAQVKTSRTSSLPRHACPQSAAYMTATACIELTASAKLWLSAAMPSADKPQWRRSTSG